MADRPGVQQSTYYPATGGTTAPAGPQPNGPICVVCETPLTPKSDSPWYCKQECQATAERKFNRVIRAAEVLDAKDTAADFLADLAQLPPPPELSIEEGRAMALAWLRDQQPEGTPNA
jgi:hypothetical protein